MELVNRDLSVRFIPPRDPAHELLFLIRMYHQTICVNGCISSMMGLPLFIRLIIGPIVLCMNSLSGPR